MPPKVITQDVPCDPAITVRGVIWCIAAITISATRCDISWLAYTTGAGSCACTTCHVVAKQGVNNLSEMEDDEMDRVEQAADYQLQSRLGCQAIVKGDVVVHIPEWNRNYVSEGH